jgi:hypothetical protein
MVRIAGTNSTVAGIKTKLCDSHYFRTVWNTQQTKTFSIPWYHFWQQYFDGTKEVKGCNLTRRWDDIQ